MERYAMDVNTLPSWAKNRPGWHYVGWIARDPIGPHTFEEYCAQAVRNDHGELREIDIYPEGAVVWWK